MTRPALTAALAAAIALVLLAAPAAAQYEPTESQVLGASEVRPGDQVTVTGTGCPPGSAVVTSFDDTQVGSTTADDQGNFSLTITVPADAQPGSHTVTSRCGDVTLTSTITVLGAATGAPSGTADTSLPRTGSNVGDAVRLGVVLLAAGGAVLALRRSRLRAAA